jgi:hypothetical protein
VLRTADTTVVDHRELVVARQPVFDRRFDVIGYELLFRPTRDSLTSNRNRSTGGRPVALL